MNETVILSVANIILFTIDIFVVLHPRLKIKNYIIYFMLISIPAFLYQNINLHLYLLIMIILGSSYISFITHKLYNFVLFPVCYIINCLVLYIIMWGCNSIYAYPPQYIHTNYKFGIFLLLLTAIFSIFPLLLLRFIYNKFLINFFEITSNKVLLFISLSILTCAYLIYAILSIFDTYTITSNLYILLIFLIILYFMLTVISIILILFTSKKNYEHKQQLAHLESLKTYTDNLENVYNNLRSFKHDYINIMSSLSLYIEEKKYAELEEFFFEHVLPMKKQLTEKNAALANLSRVKNLEIKSILYTKFLSALNKNIELTIDIPDEINDLKIDPIDLTRILGIYLDNAIEASVETAHPKVNFHFGKINESIVFIISNNYVDHGLSITQMKQKNFSTKGNEHGLGLYNVSLILNKYDNIFNEVSKSDDLFIQQLQII